MLISSVNEFPHFGREDKKIKLEQKCKILLVSRQSGDNIELSETENRK